MTTATALTTITQADLKAGMRDLEIHYSRKFTERHVRLWWAKLQDLTPQEWDTAIDYCLSETPGASLPVPRDIRGLSGVDRRPTLALPPAAPTEADRAASIATIQNFKRAMGW